MKLLFSCLYVLAFFLVNTVNLSFAKESCLATNKNKVKVEAWLSKKYEKSFLDIQKEFLEMGNTKVGLFVYPAENPSRVVAIGRCVAVYIAQYFVRFSIISLYFILFLEYCLISSYLLYIFKCFIIFSNMF